MKTYSLYFVLKDIVPTKDMSQIYSRTLNCINKTPSQPIQALGATPEKAFRHLKTQSDLHAYGVSWTKGSKKKQKADGSFYYPKVQSFHYLGIMGEVAKLYSEQSVLHLNSIAGDQTPSDSLDKDVLN